MTRVVPLALGLLMTAGVALAQPAPGWLDEAPAPRAETRHLEAAALEPIRRDDGWVSLRVRLTPKPEMRIYAHDVTGYVPLALTLDLPATARQAPAIYPASTTYLFPPTGERSRVYVQPVIVEQRVRADGMPRDRDTVVGTVRYQACDDRLCYKPATVRVAWDLTGHR